MYEPHNPSSCSDCHTDIGAVRMSIYTNRNTMPYCNCHDQDYQIYYNRNNHKVYTLIFYSANVTMNGKELDPCNNGCWLPVIIQHDGSELL